MPKNLKVVIDTNVWVSGLIYGGKPEAVLKLFIDGKIAVIISEEILTELRRIITTKFPLFKPKLALLEASIRYDAILVPLGDNTININRDPDDNKIIETAVIGEVDYIISGDNDLLVIKKYGNIVIVNSSTFLGIYQEKNHIN